MARLIVLIPHVFRLADVINFRKDYSPPSSLPSRPYIRAAKQPVSLCTPLTLRIGPMLEMAMIFLGVGFDAVLGHDVSKQFPLRNPKNTFFGIQLDAEPLEVRKCGGQVCDQVASLSRFHHYVIYIDSDC